MNSFDVASLKLAIARILARLETDHAVLTELDGRIGDGDLGITLLKAFRELDRIRNDFPPDLGQALFQAAAGVSRVSSSSFGNLLATSLMVVAKETKGTEEAAWSNLSDFLDKARTAMSARGKAALGDKTVLDAVEAAARAASGEDDPSAIRDRALAAVDAALAHYRDKPNRIGRARIFADRTIGMDDPGMVAFKVMIEAL